MLCISSLGLLANDEVPEPILAAARRGYVKKLTSYYFRGGKEYHEDEGQSPS